MPRNDYRFFHDQLSGKSDVLYDYAPVIDAGGNFHRVEGIDVLIRSLRTLLLTPRGHYPFDPEYGSDLYKKLFEPSDNITKNEILYEVKNRVEQFDSRIKIKDVEIFYTNDKKSIIVNVHIEREGVKGEVLIDFQGQHRMFGLEDEITTGL